MKEQKLVPRPWRQQDWSGEGGQAECQSFRAQRERHPQKMCQAAWGLYCPPHCSHMHRDRQKGKEDQTQAKFSPAALREPGPSQEAAGPEA